MTTVDTANLGPALRSFRTAIGLRSCELARSLGLAASSLSNVERGFRAPQAWVLAHYRNLGLTPRLLVMFLSLLPEGPCG